MKKFATSCISDAMTRTIAVTKSFMKKARVIDTDEYKFLTKAMNDHPDYTVVYKEIKKNKTKKTYKGLTYDKMRAYLVEREGIDSVSVKQFDKVVSLSKVQSASYAFVKKWFIDNYEDYATYIADEAKETNNEESEAA